MAPCSSCSCKRWVPGPGDARGKAERVHGLRDLLPRGAEVLPLEGGVHLYLDLAVLALDGLGAGDHLEVGDVPELDGQAAGRLDHELLEVGEVLPVLEGEGDVHLHFALPGVVTRQPQAAQREGEDVGHVLRGETETARPIGVEASLDLPPRAPGRGHHVLDTLDGLELPGHHLGPLVQPLDVVAEEAHGEVRGGPSLFGFLPEVDPGPSDRRHGLADLLPQLLEHAVGQILLGQHDGGEGAVLAEEGAEVADQELLLAGPELRR